MQKTIKYLFSFMICCCFIFILTGCGSFTDAEESKVIASIERVVEDGIVKLVIYYENEEIEPDTFVLPVGDDGTGIKAITTSEKEDGSGKILKIYFTDETMEPVVFELKNGKSILGIESSIDEETGENYMWIKYDDGTNSEKFLLPKGKDGVGFTGYDVETHEDGSITYLFHFSQDTPDVVVEIPAPKEGNGIKSIVSAEDDVDYILIINYTNHESEELRFKKPTSPGKWLSGSSIPESDEGDNGDYFFDTFHKIIYTKEYGTWIQVVSFDDEQEIYQIKFDLNDTLDGGVSAKMPEGSRLSYMVRRNTYFYNNGYGDIPIPTREGYQFKGWYRSKVPNVTFSPFTDFTPILSDLELFAIWEKISE